MIYGLELNGIKACITACLYPLFYYIALKSNNNKFKYLITLLFLILGIYFENRTSIICISLIFIFFHKQRIFKLNKWVLLLSFFILTYIIIFIKFDSVIGRLYIWKVIFSNIHHVPFFGFGLDSFKLNYAQWQSNYFAANLDWDKFHSLADCPSFAFNELLHFYTEFGFISILFFSVILYFNITLLLKYKTSIVAYMASINLVIFLFCMVSYSLHSIWILLLFLSNHFAIASFIYKPIKILCISSITLLLVTGITFFIKYKKTESLWLYAQFIPEVNSSEKANSYKEVFSSLSTNQLFLDDYCNYLLSDSLTDNVIVITSTHSKYFNQYEKNILLGKAYLQKSDFSKSLAAFKKANFIIPNRFIPLAYLMKIFLLNKDTSNAVEYAKKIIKMPIKVNSNTIDRIKHEAFLTIDFTKKHL